MSQIDPARLRYAESKAQALAELINAEINLSQTKKYGFALLIFSFKGPEMTWISNADRRSDMTKALEELLDRWKTGRSNEFPGGVDARN